MSILHVFFWLGIIFFLVYSFYLFCFHIACNFQGSCLGGPFVKCSKTKTIQSCTTESHKDVVVDAHACVQDVTDVNAGGHDVADM